MNGPVSWNQTHIGHFYWTTTAEAAYAEVYEETPSDTDRLFCDGGDDAHSLTVEGLSGLRVLTDGKGGELEYLVKKRPDAQNLYRVPVSIEGVGDCFVIAPDDYNGAIESAYDSESWRLAEAAGLVCLTPSGFRQKKTLYNNTRGIFWCSTSGAGTQWPNNAYTWCFADQLYHHNLSSRAYGCSIRLVQDVK